MFITLCFSLENGNLKKKFETQNFFNCLFALSLNSIYSKYLSMKRTEEK